MKTKKIYFTFALFLIVSSLWAQGTLKGKISTKQGEPLAGASVSIKGTKLATLSNSSGFFEFDKLKNGTYKLKISFVGFESIELETEIPQNQIIDLQLVESNTLSEEIIVKATRASEKTPFAISNLDKDEIKSRNSGEDIPFLLNLQPSIVSTSETGTGFGYTAMRVRGSDASRINITINGIPFNDSESHSVYWVNMPDFANSVSSIQIQRGVGTSTNGAGAFGASINFKTESLNSEPFAEIDANYGSFRTFKNSIKAGSGLINNKFAFDIRLSKITSEGFVRNGFSNHKSFAINAAYLSKKSILKASIISGDQKTGITWWGNPKEMLESDRKFNPSGSYTDYFGNTQYYDNETDNYLQTHYQLHFTHELASDLNLNVSLHYTRGDGYYEEYKPSFDGWDFNLFENYGLPNIELNDTLITVGDKEFIFSDKVIVASDMIRQKKMANDFYGFVFSMNKKTEKLDFSFGLAANKYDGDHFGKILWTQWNSDLAKDFEWYFNEATKAELNAFAKANYSINQKLSLYADFQYRHINYEMTGKDDDLKNLDQTHLFDFINPKGGIYYQLAKNQSLYASFAVAHREPTRTNFKDAIGDANATPNAEKLMDYEAGYQFASAVFSANINGYFMNYKDQLVPTGEKSDVGYDIMTNVSESYRLGIEIMTVTKLFSFLEWSFSMTLSQNKIKNFVEYADYYDADWNDLGHNAKDLGQTDIAYSPNSVISSSFDFSIFKNFTISLISKYVGKQFFDNTSNENRMLDAYFVNNMLIKYNFSTKSIKNIGLKLQINNLLNAKYSNNAYGGNYYLAGEDVTWSYYFPQAGTHFLAGVNLSF